MTFKEFATYISEIEQTASRNDMTELLSNLFKKVSHDEIAMVVYMLQGRVAPQYVKSDFGLAETMIKKAVVHALNVDSKLFNARVKKTGDVGIAVEEFKNEMPNMYEHDMSIRDVFERFQKITMLSGNGSQELKLNIISDLIQTLDSLSCRYIVRIPAQTLRLGFSDMTILDAFSWMLSGDKSHRKEIEKAYHVRPDIGLLAEVIKKEGVKSLSKIQPEVGTPIIMMKAQRLPSPKDILEKLQKGIIEPKYDGFRLQVHMKVVGKGKKAHKVVSLYSRGLDDVTYMYPDIVEGVKNEIDADSIIFEGEAIGFDEYSGNFLPFQETVQRKRKYDISEKAKEIPLKMFAFEMLYLNGTSYLDAPLKDRIKLLKNAIHTTGDIFKDTLLPADDTKMNHEKDILDRFEDAISRGLEGIMIKKLEGDYKPGARGWNWVKLKRSYSNKIDDTIDCVVMGIDRGKGKRSHFGVGAFLVGVYDAESDEFKTVAKVGTGLSDDEWRELAQRAEKLKSDHKPALYDVDKSMDVDLWMVPNIVVEIQADEITRSNIHTAGLSKDQKGYALRFPRLQRFRDDKNPQDATTVKEIQAMFEAQLNH